MTEFFKDLIIQVGYVETTPGLDKVEKPLVRALVWNDLFKINLNYLFAYNFMMAQLTVETEKGLFRKELSSESGLKLEGDNLRMSFVKSTDVSPAVVSFEGGSMIKGFFSPYYLSI